MSGNINRLEVPSDDKAAECVADAASGCRGKGGDGDSRPAEIGDARTKAQIAKEYFLSGFNCSQSVFCAFTDDYGLDPEIAGRVACGLGGGVGRMREVCGAVGGAALVFGLEYGDDKMQTYAKVQEFCAEFKRETGSIVCRELLEGVNVAAETGGAPEARTESYYRKRPCAELVALAAGILDKMLKRNATEGTPLTQGKV
jgi:C_GCAxxG_C_C family probable redox protein